MNNGNEYLVQSGIPMSRGSVLRVEDGRDLVLYLWDGAAWLTQEGDERDRYVGAGECFRLDRQGVAVLHALERSVVSITAPETERYAKRIVLARAGTGLPVELYSAAREPFGFGARLRRLWADLFEPRARPTTAAL